jgi:hypothetical protein
MGVGFGTVTQQNVLAVLLRQMKGYVRDERETVVIHADEAGKWISLHQRACMGLIFGIKLRRQVHGKALVLSAESGDLIAV